MNAIENQISLVKNEIKQELLLELRRNEINRRVINWWKWRIEWSENLYLMATWITFDRYLIVSHSREL